MYHPYTTRHNLVLGFHGCDLQVRDAVIAGHEDLKFSENEYDWLGHGIYFWENNYGRALEFAEEQQNRGLHDIKTPSVIGAIFDLGYCLDLLDSSSLQLVQSAYTYLHQSFQNRSQPMPENKGGNDRLFRHLDCAVILALHNLREDQDMQKFDTVRAAFIEGEPLYPNAGFHEKNHIQICLRNPDLIKGYFLPRVDGTQPIEIIPRVGT